MERAEEYDKITHASLNGIYVKARELDRDHNTQAPPAVLPPGGRGRRPDDADCATHASDARTHASDAQTHASDR